jgi:hypothetical protein
MGMILLVALGADLEARRADRSTAPRLAAQSEATVRRLGLRSAEVNALCASEAAPLLGAVLRGDVEAKDFVRKLVSLEASFDPLADVVALLQPMCGAVRWAAMGSQAAAARTWG